MNRRHLILTGLAAMLALLPGCAFVHKVLGPPDTLQADVQDAVRLGSNLDLIEHPDHVDAYEKAYVALGKLIKSKTITGGAVADILGGLPIKMFKGDKGTLELQLGALAFNRLFGTKLDMTKAEYVEAVANGAYAGLGQTLGH